MRTLLVSLLPVGALMSGCAGSKPASVSQFEEFGSATTHARPFAASDARTCEAARRALLSQGYVIDSAGADLVQGKKNFQPEPETHVELQLRIVCAKDGNDGQRAIAFVSANQDRYALKKSANSASLGVGALGSVSLPFTAGDESLVKVASETIGSESFYERFYALLARYLQATPEPEARTPAIGMAPSPAATPPALPAVQPEAASPATPALPASAPN